MEDTALEQLCKFKYEYRTLDGTKNNKKHPTWGNTNQPFGRLTPSVYSDGLNDPSGPINISPRFISNQIFEQKGNILNKECISNMLWCWLQMIDHHLSLTHTIDEKFPIKVPIDDRLFNPDNKVGVEISFSRSEFIKGITEPREQINSITGFMDASMIYGHDKKRNSYLRTFKKGKLKTSVGNLLPFNNGEYTNAGPSPGSFFIAGDIRCNEHLGLCALHTLFVREHNYWADKICKKCPKMCDENIYQKAKLMIESEISKITYDDVLPILLGQKLYYTGYDCQVNPQLVNSFATAAYRFGHSMVSANTLYNLKLKDTYFASYRICNGNKNISTILCDFSNTKAQKIDAKMIDDLRNFLFGKPGQGGHDLAALNIQRGRDHGLPNYNTFRDACGLSQISDLDQLYDGLSNVYDNVGEIDLFVGGLLETPEKGLLGPLFRKIIKEQFERIRDGDRLWYERRLTKEQRTLIKNTTLRDIILRNTGVTHLSKNVFITKH